MNKDDNEEMSKDKKSFFDEFKPFLKTVVDMQYYTFQTISKYKEHFEKIEKELEFLRSNLTLDSDKNKENDNSDKKLDKLLEEDDKLFSNSNKLTMKDIKNEEEVLQG